jgi:hypothetical protein
LLRRALAGLLTVLLIGGSILAAPVPTAAAGDQDYQAATRLLARYGLVQGDQLGYRWGEAITRAEVAKLLVYSLGYGSQTQQYQGRREFPDTAGHWAEGAISLARSLGIMRGYPEGDFRPESPVSYAETVTALARLVGLEPGTEPWPNTYFVPARNAGIIPADMAPEERPGAAAIRGDVFVLLKRTLADVENFKGQTLLQLYLDKVPPSLTVDPLPQETPSPSLAVSGTAPDAATVKINGTPAALADGYFRQDLPLTLGPNTIRVQAVDDAGNLTESTAQVKRLPGAPDSLSLRGPASVKAGQSAIFLLSVLDETGTDTADRTRVQADVSPDLGTFDPQTGTFIAGKKAGTAVITVRAGRSQSSLSVTVEPGPLDHIAVTPAESSLGAGESANFAVTGYDAFGNSVAVSDVQWSASGGSIQAGGRYQAPDISGTAPYSITADVSGLSATARVYPLNFQAADVKVTASANSFRANGTAEVVLTATVVDDKGKPVTDYKGTLSVDTSDSRIAQPVESVVPVAAGAAQVRLKAGTVPGPVRVTVSTNLGRTGAITLTGTAQQIQSVRLTGRALPSTDGQPLGLIEAVALDQDGSPIRTALQQTVVVGLSTSPAGAARFVSNGQETADVALFDRDPDTGDVRAHMLIQYNAGAGTVLIDGKAKPKSMEWVRVLAGAIAGDQAGMPARLQIEPLLDGAAGQTLAIYVNVLDASGYRITQPGPLSRTSVSLRDQNGNVWLPETPDPAEPGRFEFRVTQQQAGTYTYTALLQPQGATATAAGKVTAGVLHHIDLDALPDAFPADGRTQISLRAKLLDAEGNLVNLPYQVTFSRQANWGVTQPPDNLTITARNGVAELKVTAGQVVATETYKAQAASGLPGSAALTSQGQPQRLVLRYGDNGRNGTPDQLDDHIGTAGVPFTVVAEVQDASGGLVSYESNRRVTLTVLNLDEGGVATTISSTVKEGKAFFTFTLKNAGTYAIKAESAGVQSALTQGYGGTADDAVVQPSFYTGVRVSVDLTALKAGDASNSYALVRAELVDANGNPAINQSVRPISVDLNLGVTTYGYFTTDNQDDSAKVPFRTVLIPVDAPESAPVTLYPARAGYVTVQGQTPGGLKSLPVKLTVVDKFGGIAKLDVEQPTELPANAPHGSRLITITAKDSSGRRLSDMSGPVMVAALSAGANMYDPVTDLALPAPAALTMDRGQTTVLVWAPGGTLAAFEVSDPASPVTKPFYVQF